MTSSDKDCPAGMRTRELKILVYILFKAAQLLRHYRQELIEFKSRHQMTLEPIKKQFQDEQYSLFYKDLKRLLLLLKRRRFLRQNNLAERSNSTRFSGL